jgi:peroxiredoxin family protein
MKKEKATIIVFSGELDKILAAFTVAIGAAASGMDVTMFFTFWGLNVLMKKKLIRGKGVKQKMMNVMNNPTAESLPLSKFNMLGAGPIMMKSLMKDSKFPQVKELMSTAKEFGVKFIACTTSIGFMGLTKKDFIPEVDSYAGVTTYLDVAKKSKLNLFIS